MNGIKSSKATTPFSKLSQRCQNILIEMKKKEWTSRIEISKTLDITVAQITSSMELLKYHGYKFDSRIIENKNYYEYRFTDGEQREQVQRLATRSVNASLERLIIEMNRIRNTSNERGIRKIASNALEACGLLTD